MTVEIDDSFKKPGAVPFKWEIRPGVPKLQHQHSSPLQPKKHLSPPPLLSPSPPSLITTSRSRSRHSSPISSSVFLHPDLQTRGSSFRSDPRSHSERWRTERRQQPEVVAPAGCFVNLPSLPKLLLLRKKSTKKKRNTTASSATVAAVPEEDYGSDGSETLSRWSVSSRRSLQSPMYMDSPASPYSYSSSSYDQQPSPRPPPPPPMGDAQWAGFALF